MKFLKFITAAALAILLLLLLGNLMAYVFPTSAPSATAQDDCYDQYPSPTPDQSLPTEERTKVFQDNQEKIEACRKAQSTTLADRNALAFQSALLRAVMVFIVMVVVAIILFKRYPYLAGALIAGGLLFVLSYPWTSQWGLYDEDYSSAIQRQVQLTKFIIEAVGFLGLLIADLFFFEKERPRHDDHPSALPPQTPPQMV